MTDEFDGQQLTNLHGRQIAFVSNRALGSEGRQSTQPSSPYALYVFDLDLRETKLAIGGGGLGVSYPS